MCGHWFACLCTCVQIRCLGEAVMAPAWVIAPARSPPWVGELTLKLGPTGAGVHAFWGTDSGCQCTRSGPRGALGEHGKSAMPNGQR